MQKERIAALEGIEIFYTGQRLDQGDLDTWISGLHFARLQEMGQRCHFTAYSILKLMRKTDSGKNRDILDTRLSRLNATAVRIKSGKYSYEGSLIDSVYREEETREYVVVFNPKMQALFASTQFTQIDLDVRQELDGKPLAQWLHCFYASHAKPFPYKATTLLTLSGSENSAPHSARQKLIKALDAVAEASNRHVQPFSYEIQDDLVHVKKRPSRSQQRHLKKILALNASRS
ncbi:MAG: plasmid replication initiator TrfA [Gallionella sp.]|nr:plasmid replication initiator TrfA [Gallionella sp.]MDD4946511.1 plasmid replication initiator TrfA [Gallionella sp.]